MAAAVAGPARAPSWWVLWLAFLLAGGAAVGAASATRRGEPTLAPADLLRLLLLATIPVHLAARYTAGAPSPWVAAHGVLLVVAAALLPGWWRTALVFATSAALEAGGLALREPAPTMAEALGLASALAVLAAIAAVTHRLYRAGHRERAAMREELEERRRLHEEAAEYSAATALGGQAEAEPVRAAPSRDGQEGFAGVVDLARQSLSPDAKTTRILRAVAGLDGDLDRVLGLARRALGARGVLLFLLEADCEHLALRRAVAAAEGDGPAPEANQQLRVRKGEGLIGHAAQTGLPALFTNLGPESLRPALWRSGAPSPSLAVVPVREHEVFRGVLVADSGRPGAFARDQEELLAGFAGDVGAFLEAARKEARRERQSHRLESLRSISEVLTGTLNLGTMLDKMVDFTRAIVPYDRTALFLVDPTGSRLAMRAERGFGVEEGEGVSIAMDYGLPGFIATHRRAMLFTNLRTGRRGVEILPGASGQERIRSFVGVPIRHQEGLVGVWVLAADEPARFDADDLDFLSVVAASSKVLISNAFLHQKVELMAHTDGLTGLYNHRHFQERLQSELDRSGRTRKPVSLLLLDIDHFKKINDTYGHPFGDLVLKELAACLGRIARRIDVTARYGGEEFAVILVETDRAGCRTTATRLLKAIRGIHIPHEGAVFSFTASLGTATFPDDAATREELVRAADQALYAAKDGGRNRVKSHAELPAPAAAAGRGEA